jgi:hypothetical protein
MGGSLRQLSFLGTCFSQFDDSDPFSPLPALIADLVIAHVTSPTSSSHEEGVLSQGVCALGIDAHIGKRKNSSLLSCFPLWCHEEIDCARITLSYRVTHCKASS